MQSTVDSTSVPSQPATAVLTVTSSAAPRMVAVIVQGVEVHVPCPSWCIENHTGQRLVELDDLSHFGAELSVQLPTFSGATESSITVHLASYPFSVRDDRMPHLSLVSPDGDSTPLTADLAETVAQGLERHAAMMRALSAVGIEG